MVTALPADPRPSEEHTLGRFPERNRNNPLALGKPLPGTQEERHPGPAPVVDLALQRDERFGIRLRIDAFLGPVSGILPAHDILGVDRQHAAKDLVLLLAR